MEKDQNINSESQNEEIKETEVGRTNSRRARRFSRKKSRSKRNFP